MLAALRFKVDRLLQRMKSKARNKTLIKTAIAMAKHLNLDPETVLSWPTEKRDLYLESLKELIEESK